MSFTDISTIRNPSSFSSAIDSDSDDSSRVVRFDSECVLIPDLLSKRPKIVTKTYSLPVWKRRSASTGSDDTDPHEETSPTIKVHIPSFMARSSRSPTRQTIDSYKPLSPCLVHRSPSSPTYVVAHREDQRKRRPSLPLPPTTDAVGKPLATVPLRACCPNCVPVTEESMKEGDRWKEKFSRGARRKRSASCSSDDFSMGSPPSTSGFAAVKQNCSESTVLSSHAVSIKVDEVDKIRKSREHAEATKINNAPETPTKPSFPPRASPIQEEDDDQLFPLPSPRRTPSSSPAGSENTSPLPSPNASSAALVLKSSSSRESLNTSGSDEVLSTSLTRAKKPARCEKGLLMPDSRLRLPPSNGSPTTEGHNIVSELSAPSSHSRISSSPGPSPKVKEFVIHERFSSTPNYEKTLPECVQLPHSPSTKTTPSKTLTKKRSQGFSPSTFFKEALKGVSSMGTGSSGNFSV